MSLRETSSFIARLLEEVVSVPTYAIVGVAGEDRLVYLSTKEGVADLYSISLTDKKTSVRLTKGGALNPQASPRTNDVVYATDVGRGRELHRAYVVDARGGPPREVGGLEPCRITGIAWDGSDLVLSVVRGLRGFEIWHARPGRGAEKVFTTDRVVFVTSVWGGLAVGMGWLEGDPYSIEMFLLDLRSLEFRSYTPKRGSTNKKPVVMDGRVLFSSNYEGREALYVLDYGSMELSRLKTRYADHVRRGVVEYVDWGWLDSNETWFIGKRNGRCFLYLNGREVPLPPGYSERAVAHVGRVYVDRSAITRAPGIIEVDASSGAFNWLVRTSLPPRVAARLGRVYMVRVRSEDGLLIPTFVVESRLAGRPGPTVVYVHGGPWSEVADRWSYTLSSLAASGFHVVAPNFRGSTGYGEDFRRLDIGDPGGLDLKDVVAVARWAKNSGLASKIAVMGYSYGGFMTYLATVKEPGLWDAGVAGAGIVDWGEMYELGDSLFKRFVDILFAGKRELWGERSAVNFVSELRAPLCMIHPQNDTRTPLRPVLKYATRLSELGKTFELHVIPDVGHVINDTESMMKLLYPAILFLKRFLTEATGSGD